MIFQPSSNFWRFMVLFPTTSCLELGKETDHQVRASARSGFSSLTWMRLGWMNPIAVAIRIPVNVGIMKLLPAVKLFRIDDNQQFGGLPVHLHMPLDVVGIPAIEHFEQDLIDLLVIGLGDA